MEVLIQVPRLSAVTVSVFIVCLVLRLARHIYFYTERNAYVLLGYFFSSSKEKKRTFLFCFALVFVLTGKAKTRIHTINLLRHGFTGKFV